MTLRQIIEQNPTWADLPVVVYNNDGNYDYVGAAGTVYLDSGHTNEETGKSEPVVVFALN